MSTHLSIDLNADLGETTAGNPVADDAAMLELVSSANVACGFHAGDPHDIARTVAAAAARGVTVGAHVGYRDAPGFGRRFMDYAPAELADEVLYQIGALDALARAHGTAVAYVKPHGALYNAIVHHEAQAQAVIDGVAAFGRDLPVLLLPGSVAIDAATAKGLPVVREAFADRGYNPDGTLVSRRLPGAVLATTQEVVDRVIQVATTGTVTATDGTRVDVGAQSVCVHGDSPGAVEMARGIVAALEKEGIAIRAFAGQDS
ncbi:LamB/YcsF family protein [Corynebacterium uberis]|uniref:LamB/YcsF family protein n=1 Tax=Corynebacterium TaxID=1716 RepID=UPI001D0B38BB|nr:MULTISPECIES: 5-oxoprolinase subunit PxpA [Corynebacterium]MCZ9308820.1 LamB/YcsF family protein [Corynebacterium sp. c6VSa_13]UDL72653.1 LamB/YcsF family protein [Corynebacterium uberis]UDL76471.1 LamB/YcsF family protein [Corynebacterium uberis]UDL78683.1 LamB/YcsF family protein [Corynebacterium uberis]UDL80962.1 LamB/YcsF family protein [Corynebacterium uberis]